MKVNDRLLARIGSAWNDWGGVDIAKLPDSERSASRDELVEALSQEFGDAPLVVIKDPRICRLMPLWLEALSEADFRVRAILAMRTPSDVAASLARRNGIGRARSILLWLRYVLDAESHSRDLIRTFVSYDDLLANWCLVIQSISADLDVPLQWMDINRARAVEEFLSADLRHSRESSQVPSECLLSALADEVAQKLGEARHGYVSGAARERFSEVSRQLDIAYEVHMDLKREESGVAG